MKLELVLCEYYRVKRGQSLSEIARTFHLPPRVLAGENALHSEVEEGQVLRIPKQAGNLYRVGGGESMTLLCGSKENFCARNSTDCLYPTQEVIL
ncbi:MAG: LysM peptidoglycan-binding domain-containing protein [Clostridiales bacterium]|nr:LysM peptidoglycan-binding domain-containing protein [Clostridiales bacterium]